MNVYDSLDAIGAEPTPTRKAEIPFRFPPSTDELTDRGLVKRLIRKQPGDEPKDAIARARTMPWWSSVAEVRPYGTARFWVFLVDRMAACS
jgi:hypothetical protein